MPVAISIRHLGKRYRLSEMRSDHPTLREFIMTSVRRERRGDPAAQHADTSFWALRDVSFDVQAGETVGILGGNGAGKSTLLKIISRIVQPTTGFAAVNGRLSSLLEAGAGFHPDLTGRENVYLNGAILGLRRREVAAKLDAIVSFAGVEKFVDTQVKHYSSGMYMRLAFSVAAHVEPDIMIIDEMLAVGDAQFRKKCVDKIAELSNGQRTILFVSHDMSMIQGLCTRAVRLRSGLLVDEGPPSAVVSRYLREVSDPLVARKIREDRRRGRVWIEEVILEGGNNAEVAAGAPVRFVFLTGGAELEAKCSFSVHDEEGREITYFDSGNFGPGDGKGNRPHRFECEIPSFALRPGRYGINVVLVAGGRVEDRVEGALVLDVGQGSLNGRKLEESDGNGSIAIAHRWLTPAAG